MSSIIILFIACVFLLCGYFVYGSFLEHMWGIDKNRPTPAHTMKDGIDYVPSKKFVLFGHQFASIAGAGPINGPIIAAMFGWLPVLLWILFGGIFFGAMQDFAALYISVRNKGKSLGSIIEQYIGKHGKNLFLIFVWLFCILIIAAFADIVASTFNGIMPDKTLNIPNASTASTSMFFIGASLVYAFIVYKFKPQGVKSAIIAIALLVTCIALGLLFPVFLSKSVWLYITFVYIFIASITPVWILLQPRDYLNSYLLLAMIILSCVGILFTNPTIQLPAFTGFIVNGQYLFPILFVTVACGAISGFHTLVSTGTCSKQIDNEADMKFIGYGSMLFESLLAVIALIAVGALYINGKMPEGTPPVIFANGIASFLTTLHIPLNISFSLITLAVSAFALTSLDSVTRIGRLAFQELVTDTSSSQKSPVRVFFSNNYVATLVTVFFGYILSIGGYENIWALFGTSNQLLAALSLIAIALYLKKHNKKSKLVIYPLFFMFLVSMSSLVLTIVKLAMKLITQIDFILIRDGFQLTLSILMLTLATTVALQCYKAYNKVND